VSLARHRSTSEVELLRQELSAADSTTVLDEFQRRAAELSESLDRATYRTVGQVPEHGNVVARVRAWLADHAARITIADSARSA
jgi:hypothetical protein